MDRAQPEQMEQVTCRGCGEECNNVLKIHPQAPTGIRLVIELKEELVLNKGGYGLFSGVVKG